MNLKQMAEEFIKNRSGRNPETDPYDEELKNYYSAGSKIIVTKNGSHRPKSQMIARRDRTGEHLLSVLPHR